MEFVLVKGGCFQMGDAFGDGGADEKPVHEVCVDDFYMGKYEVTVGQFKEFVRETGYQTEAERGDGAYHFTGREWKMGKAINWRNPGFRQTDRHPVVCVSHNDALAFAEWLGRKTGQGIRLPTEAEWEYAARSGGKKYKYGWGSGNPSANIADVSLKREFPSSNLTIWEGYDDGYVYTAPVGSFPPNELGLCDMTGNVWEWCSDWYGEKYYGESRKTNPQGPDSGQYRVGRGGSWIFDPGGVRAATRGWDEPSCRDDDDGFRLVFSPAQ
jgi:formylglycine-generating enzyme required for sulfatase activity